MTGNTHSILAFVPPNQYGKFVLKAALYFRQTLGLQLFDIAIIAFATTFLVSMNL